MLRQLKNSTTRWRPASPIFLASPGSAGQPVDGLGQTAGKPFRIDRIVRRRLGEMDIDDKAGLVVDDHLGMPPTSLPTTGVPQAIASRLMMPNGS